MKKLLSILLFIPMVFIGQTPIGELRNIQYPTASVCDGGLTIKVIYVGYDPSIWFTVRNTATNESVPNITYPYTVDSVNITGLCEGTYRAEIMVLEDTLYLTFTIKTPITVTGAIITFTTTPTVIDTTVNSCLTNNSVTDTIRASYVINNTNDSVTVKWRTSNDSVSITYLYDPLLDYNFTTTLQCHTTTFRAIDETIVSFTTKVNCYIKALGTNTVTPTGIAEITTQLITFYPNPVNDILNINSADNDMVCVYDITGKVIYNNNTKTIDMGELKNGIYFVRVINVEGKAIANEKIIKN